MLDQLLDISSNLGIETLLLLPVLVALEVILSADNAIALAAIAQGLSSEKLQERALNFGLVVAFVLRISLILAASWVLKFWQFEVLGAAYLLWLVYQHFTSNVGDDQHHHGPRFTSLWQAIPTIAFTDLAFSLDSVTTAIALSREVWVVLLGGTIGVLTLRFMAGLFIRWLEEFEYLEDAGFVTVAIVGVRLLIRVINPEWVPPEWVMVSIIAMLFVWGFSKRSEPAASPEAAAANGRYGAGHQVAAAAESSSEDDWSVTAQNGPYSHSAAEDADPEQRPASLTYSDRESE